MKLKFWIFGVLVVAAPVFMLTALSAKADASGVVILSPVAGQSSYAPGDGVKIEWSSGFSPSLRQPMVVSLLGPKFKRIRLGSVIRKQANGIYSVDWKVPGDFFEKNKISAGSVHFRIEIRQGGDLRNRFIGKNGQIQIQKTAPAQGVDGAGGNAVPNPGVALSERSRLVARYEFKSLLEAWVVKKLTAVNDTANDGFDLDPTEATDAVEKVYVRYPDQAGVLKVIAVPYSNGKAAFSGMDFYIPSRGIAMLELYVEPVDPKTHGEQFSGKTFRLGIQDVANNASTFEAVGQVSDATVHSLGSLQMTSTSINETVVKESVLEFAIPEKENRSLFNGDNTVFDFTVSSASASLGRLVFDVNQSGLTAVDGVRLYRNGQLL
ncbi:hypothetical protein HZA44_04090, partial [Candidatus Peregrinibacteria bacterium]|nr:hypothetical protein [Candidatus Peregrinibacteria bacterium]